MKMIKTQLGRMVEDYEDFIPHLAGESGPVSIQVREHPAREPLALASMRTAVYGGDELDQVSWSHRTRWRSLREQGVGVWMTDLPIEQAQARAQVAPIRGRSCLVAGLGLGIAARLIARSTDRVVVVEKSGDVIRLARPALAATPEGERIDVAESAIEDYDSRRQRHDWAFLDTWQSDGEATFNQVVVPLRRLLVERKLVPSHARVIAWNECVMRGQLIQKLWSSVLCATPDQLVEESGSIFHDFALPYWRWLAREEPEPERARAVASAFARLYESGSGWLDDWRATL